MPSIDLPTSDKRYVSRRLGRVTRTLESLLGGIRSAAVSRGDDALASVQGALSGALDSARDVTRWVEGEATQDLAAVQKAVRDNPLPAVAIALGAGAILAMVLLNRR
jgi:ElaB/YqjD/DUF883 family membrane-anchored ribosome-binding protein